MFVDYSTNQKSIEIKINHKIWRGSHICPNWFSYESYILTELEFGTVAFSGKKKTGVPRVKPSEQGQNQQKTQPTYGTRPELHPGQIGGRAKRSHHCASPAPHTLLIVKALKYNFSPIQMYHQLKMPLTESLHKREVSNKAYMYMYIMTKAKQKLST